MCAVGGDLDRRIAVAAIGRSRACAATFLLSRCPVSDLPAHSEAARAAETFAMHRLTQSKTANTILATIAIAVITCVGIRQADAAPPSVRHANIDFEASGFVAPAGMVHPSMYQGGVMPAGYFGSPAPCGCDAASGCDGGCSGGGCDAACGTGCGGSRCGVLGCGGLLGKLKGEGTACGGCGASGCSSCGGMSNLRNFCIFCRGSGCGVCQMFGHGHMICDPRCLLPYCEQGICAQRWYDISAEAMFLGHTSGGLGGPVTTLGVAPGAVGDPVPPGQVVMSLGDADGGDELEAGARLSAAFIWGPGGNIEFTYVGGQKWNSSASVQDPGGNLFSVISDFGRLPGGVPPGFDDTDRSIFQGLQSESEFHSGEINYRRRTVGPYCRFQGSWLVGLRYIRFEDALTYNTFGDPTRFFSSRDSLHNNLFGPQIGFDFWWNVCAGVNFGVGCKGAWVQNDINRRTTLTYNSLDAGAPGTDVIANGDQDSTVLGEFEMKLIYRLSHSWALRSTYYAVAVDDMAFGTLDADSITSFAQGGPLGDGSMQMDSAVFQGVSLGAEYTW